MDESQRMLLISLVLSGGLLLGILILGWWFRRGLMSLLGWSGVASCGLVSVGILAPPFIWCLALLPSFSHLEAPDLDGIGGQAYGLYYDLYPTVILYYAAHWLVFVLMLLILSYTFPSSTAMNVSDFLIWIRRKISGIENIELIFLAVATALCVVYFTAIGWDRLIYSPMARFERSIGVDVLLDGLSRIIIFFALALGVCSSILILISSKPLTAALSVIICSLPFIPLASRGFSVLICSAYLAYAFRFRGLGRMAALVIFPVFASVLLLLPLIMRGLEYTGFVAMKDAGLSMIGDLKGNFTLSRLLSPVLANMSQGFPVLVDVFVQSENGPVLADVPFGYIWRSFSPTLSFIDGFSTTWVEFNPRVNAFTPFNTVAELYGLNPVFSISFIATVYTVVTLMIRRLTGRGIKGALVALVLLALMAVSLFQLQQYQTRTFMRVIYLILLVGGSGLFLFPRQIQGRLNNRDAKK